MRLYNKYSDVSFDVEIHETQMALRGLEADLARIRDIKQLKRSLKHYRVERWDDDLESWKICSLSCRGPARVDPVELSRVCRATRRRSIRVRRDAPSGPSFFPPARGRAWCRSSA